MKKRILFFMLLAIILAVGVVTPVAADPGKGNVVDRDQGTQTETYSWASGPYLVEDVFHVNWQYVSYSDGSVHNSFSIFYIQTWYLDGVEVGIYKEGEKYSYNDNLNPNVSNYLVQHNGYIYLEGWEGYVSSYHYWYNFANGEVRVEFEKIQ